MPSNIDLKELWNRQTGAKPDINEIVSKANKYKKAHLYKLVRTNILLVLTSVFICWVIYKYQPQMITTKIGTLLVLLAMALFLTVYNGMIPLLLKINDNTSIHEYLQNLIKLKAKQKFLQTTMTNVYYILLSSGLFLYMIEPTMGRPLTGILLTYGLSFGWVVFSWFYFRKRAIRKQEKEINELLAKFDGIEQQLKD